MPAYPGFCAGSNPSQSLQADCEKTVNWYEEEIESQAAPTGKALYPTPGFMPFLSTTDVGLRGALSVGGRTFAVMGGGFYEWFAGQTATRWGTVAQNNYPATLSYNGLTGGQIGITSGGNWYNFQLATNTLTQVAALTGKATMGGMLNARFVAFDINTGTVYGSALNDGTTWTTGTVFFQNSQTADPWQAMIVKPPVIWLIGEQTSQLYYDAGSSPQPYAPYPGQISPYGTPSPFACGSSGDYITWLSKSDAGQGIIVAAKGYAPQRISNYAVETAIAGYARHSVNSLGNAEVLTYQDQGHLWGVYSFPDGPGTWAVDLETGAWHERGTWTGTTYDIWTPRRHVYAFNKHLVGNRATSTISEMDVTFGSEAGGGVIRRLRIGPPLYASSRQRLIVSRFQVRAEAGLGLSTGQGSDPYLMARFSKDAKTWSTQRQASVGKLGQYTRRCVFHICGSSDTLWVPEITVSDPIPWRLSGAEIDGVGLQFAARAA